ncbi:MAG TPA: VOC family protein [Thermoanaerobaculia bacterium]
MLGKANCLATIAVRDLEASKKFYEKTLGLKRMHSEGDQTVSYESGESELLVYRSAFAGTNLATVATWSGEDVESVVRELKARGVKFEHYDFPGGTRDGDVHLHGDMKAAWFKDPDGNILAIVSR